MKRKFRLTGAFLCLTLSASLIIGNMPIFAENDDEHVHEDFEICDDCHIEDGYVIDGDAEFNEDSLVAASCKHNWQKTYQYANSEKHYYTRACSICGKTTANNKLQNHVSDGTKSYSQKDDTYHNTVYKCKYCGQNYSKQTKHSYSYGVCRYCGASKPTTTKSTTAKKSTTTKTSPTTKTSSGIQCASRDKQGKCSWLVSIFKNDNEIHATCPKCGASGTDATYVSRKKRGTSVRVGSGKKFAIYHQQVKCNNCGKKYYNYCYDEDL